MVVDGKYSLNYYVMAFDGCCVDCRGAWYLLLLFFESGGSEFWREEDGVVTDGPFWHPPSFISFSTFSTPPPHKKSNVDQRGRCCVCVRLVGNKAY
jgi:hypothetical protein